MMSSSSRIETQFRGVLLDQNIPNGVTERLRALVKGAVEVLHVYDAGFEGADDRWLFDWSCESGFAILTYDEDFADRRLLDGSTHFGIVRLRVDPTTEETTFEAVVRLLGVVGFSDLRGRLAIVDNSRVRIR